MTLVWKCSPLSMFIKMICFEGYNYYSLHSPTHMSAEMYVSTLSSIGNPEIFIQYWILIILSYVAPFHLLHISLNERPPLIGRIQSSPQVFYNLHYGYCTFLLQSRRMEETRPLRYDTMTAGSLCSFCSGIYLRV